MRTRTSCGRIFPDFVREWRRCSTDCDVRGDPHQSLRLRAVSKHQEEKHLAAAVCDLETIDFRLVEPRRPPTDQSVDGNVGTNSLAPGSLPCRSRKHRHDRSDRTHARGERHENRVHDGGERERSLGANHGPFHADDAEIADRGVRGQREARPRRLRTRRQRGESPRVPFNHDNGSPALLSQRARIWPVAFVGPPNGGSPAPRPRLVAEDLLLYDKDGQSLLDDHALRILIALHQENLTAQAIASRYRVPIAACYRRVRRLTSLGLISEAGFVTEGRR